jgi:hypothetical protein
MRDPTCSTWLLRLGLAWLCGNTGCASDGGKGDESNEASTSSEDEAPTTDPDTGASSACDPRPEYPEVYSSCTGMTTCDGEGICAYQVGMDPAMDPAYCTSYCMFDLECPSVGACTATPICLTPSGGGTGACALDCGDGKQCPEGMECLEDMDSGGIRYICF